MQFTTGTIFKGSLALHDAFKQLAPKGLILEIVHPLPPTLYYRDGKYLYKSPSKEELMDGAWYALQNANNKFKVVKSPRLRYTTTKALHD